MVDRNETNTARRRDGIHESVTPAERSHSTRKTPPNSDDIIMSLANSYENKRARQVTEWEMLRRSTRLGS